MNEEKKRDSEQVLVQLRNLVGEEDVNALITTVMEWREAAQRVEVLARELEELRERERRARLEALVQRGLAEGRLTPAMREWALTLTPEQLKTYLEVAPIYVRRETPREPASKQRWFELSSRDRERLYREHPEEYYRLRKEALGF